VIQHHPGGQLTHGHPLLPPPSPTSPTSPSWTNLCSFPPRQGRPKHTHTHTHIYIYIYICEPTTLSARAFQSPFAQISISALHYPETPSCHSLPVLNYYLSSTSVSVFDRTQSLSPFPHSLSLGVYALTSFCACSTLPAVPTIVTLRLTYGP